MKRIIFFTILLIWLFCSSSTSYAQQVKEIHPAQQNYKTFSNTTRALDAEVITANKGYDQHPELGMLFAEAPCSSCFELIDKRTEKTKTFIKKGAHGTIMQQTSTEAMHYRDEQGNWKTIKSKLNATAAAGVYEALEQPVPVLINTVQRFTALGVADRKLRFNNDLELVYLSPGGHETSLGKANWSKYSAGDDGVYLTDAWPGIDIEMYVFRGAVKTNYIINYAMPVYANGKLLLRDHIKASAGLKINVEGKQQYAGNIDVTDREGKTVFNIGTAVAYEKDGADPSIQKLLYGVNGNLLDIIVPGGFLNRAAASYPVIIDPVVSSATNFTINGSSYSATLTTGCVYAIAASAPGMATISDMQFSFAYLARGGAMTKHGGYRLKLGSCISPSSSVAWSCNTNFPGVCSAGGGPPYSFYTGMSSCLPTPQCTAYPINLTMEFSQNYANTPACDTTYILGVAPLIVTVFAVLDSASISSSSSSICAGQTATLTATAYGTQAPYSFVWMPGSISGSTITVTPSATTTYTVVAGGAGCTTVNTATATVTVVSTPVISGNTAVCVGSATTLSSSSGGGTWTSSNTNVATVGLSNGVVSGASAGTSVITYSSNCGNVTATVTVNTTAPGPIGGPDPNNLCTPYFVQMTNSVAGGVWSSSNTNVGVITPGGALTGSSPGSVIGSTVVSYSTGCGAVSTRTITTTRSAPTTIYGFTTPAAALHLCPGAMITLSNDGIPTGTWSSSNSSVIVINSTTGVMTTAGLGTVNVLASNICGGRGLGVVVEVPTAISGNLILCGATTTTLSNGTPMGTWSSGNTALATIDQNGVVQVVPGGGYGSVPITYTLLGGCSVDTVVTISATPSAIGGATNLCIGTSIVLSNSLTGGTWSSGSPGIATVNTTGTVTGLSPGKAVISYANACGIATTTVTVSATTFVNAGSVTICAGNTIALSNATTGGMWSSSNTNIATVSAGGTVVGVATGTANILYATTSCTVYTTTVSVGVPPGVINGNTHVCLGNNTTLTNATNGGAWSSSNTSVASIAGTGTASTTIAGVAVGTSFITYTMPGGCYSTTMVTVHQPPANIAGSMSVCAGFTIGLSNSVGGGVWTSASPGIATVGANTGIVGGVSAGTAVISYATTNSAGCIATASITVLPAPVAGTITGSATVCTGATISLTNAAAGGVWSSGTMGAATVSATGVVYGVSAGTTTVSYTVSGACGPASAIKIITVVNMPDAGVITGPDHVCTSSSITLSNTIAGGIWNSSDGTVTVANGIVAGVAAGTATVSYIVTNSCGADTATWVLTVDAAPNAGSIDGPDSVCAGAVFSLSETVPGGVWTSSSVDATINSSTGQVHALSEGVVTISYTTSAAGNSCMSVATHTLTIGAPTFAVHAVVTDVTCHGAGDGSISVTINGGMPPHTYTWSTMQNTATINNLVPGLYILNVGEAATQCIKDTAFTVTEPDSIIVKDSVVNDLCGMGVGTVAIHVSGGTTPYSYLWSNNATSASLQQLHAGVYTVTATDVHNCAETHTAIVADSTCSAIIIHDVITPNGDGINDVWVIEGITGYPASVVHVFDKWGDAVYEKTNYKNDWDGRGAKGLLPDGTYFYIIKLNSANMTGGVDTFTGTILIKR